MTTVRKTDRDRFATAVHEAAHAVVGLVHGLDIERVALLDGDPQHAGACWYSAAPFGIPAVVTMAGTVGEMRWRRGPNFTARDVRLRLDVNHDDRAQLASDDDPFTFDITRKLVERCWSAIGELAVELYAVGEIGEGDVIKALRIPRGRSGPAYLSALRSGMWALT